MKKNGYRIVVLALCFMACVYFAGVIHGIYGAIGGGARQIQRVLDAYIIRNSGSFPSSQFDLEWYGFLQRQETNGGVEYFVKYTPGVKTTNWQPAPNFEKFTIHYGFDIDDMDGMSENSQASTKVQVILIEGPYKMFLTSTYSSITEHWCKLMLKEKEKLDSADLGSE